MTSRDSSRIAFFCSDEIKIGSRRVIFSEVPIKNYYIIEVKKARKEEFYNYCIKAGIPKEIIDEVYKISEGYVENARYYIKIIKRNGIKTKEEFRRFFKKKNSEDIFIIISFFFASIRYFFYFIGISSIGSFFASMSYIFMVFYFMKKKRIFTVK